MRAETRGAIGLRLFFAKDVPTMQGDSAILDHVVVNVQAKLDAGVAAYRNLGFNLTERGHHTLGTSNHLALFQHDYVELLGVEADRPSPAWDIVANPVGIQALAFKTRDAAALYRRLTEERLPAQPPEEFSRPVTLSDGTFDARFKVVGVNPSPLHGVRIFFCQHLTPHLVWRREWQSHANGATGITHLMVAVSDPARAGDAFARLLGVGSPRPIGGGLKIEAGGVSLQLLAPDAVRQSLAPALQAAPKSGVAGLGVRTGSLQAATHALARAGVRRAIASPDRILVAAADAMGVVLEFVA
jgi:catechol 2,3-dioxygenase-like lactoylglutathione lyase family enzyme